MNRQPSQIVLATEGSEIVRAARGLRISRRKKMVSADTTNVAALKYSARFTGSG